MAVVERKGRERSETHRRLADVELALAQRVNRSLLPEDILRPDLAVRFVLLSGDPDDPDITAFTRATGVPVLAKPFELASIEAAVRRVVLPVTAP